MGDVLVLTLIALLTFAAVLCLLLGGQLLMLSYLAQWAGANQEASQKLLNELFIANITPRDVLVLTVTAIVVVGLLTWLLTGNPLLTLVAGVTAFFLPGPLFTYLRRLRKRKFEEQLPLALDQLVSSTRAGLNLVQALEEASAHAPVPVCQEMGLIVRDYQVGWDIKSAINAARRRLASHTFDLAAAALVVNQEKGGNLPEALATISNSLKEIWRLEQKMVTASAEGRKAVRVISVVPLFIFLIVSLAQPDIITTLTSTFLGWVCVTVAALLYGTALWWLKNILDVDV